MVIDKLFLSLFFVMAVLMILLSVMAAIGCFFDLVRYIRTFFSDFKEDNNNEN